MQQCIRNKIPLPDKFVDAPTLPAWLEWFYVAFIDLTSCRSGMGDGPIMWTAIDAYAQRHGFTSFEDYSFFKDLISAMDLAYLEYSRKKQDVGKISSNAKPARMKG